MSKKRCQAKNKRGMPCRAVANENGFCFTHNVTDGKEKALMRSNAENSLIPKRTPTRQQERFIENMANPAIKSQTEAAVKAGCPPKNARITASKWLTKANIRTAIQERKQRALDHAQVTPEEVLGSAVFQMRSSIDDVLDDEGSFDIRRARETGAVDLLKKHKETVRTTYKQDGDIETIKTVEVELLTNQDARKEVASYLGLEKFAPEKPSRVEHYVTITRQVAENQGLDIEEVFKFLVKNERYPAEVVEEVGQILLGTGD